MGFAIHHSVALSAFEAVGAVAVIGVGGGGIDIMFFIYLFHITTLVAGLLMGAVAVVGVGVGCTITMPRLALL